MTFIDFRWPLFHLPSKWLSCKISLMFLSLPLTSPLHPHSSLLTPLIPHLSPLTSHLSPLTSHLSPINYQLSPTTYHLSPLPALRSRLHFSLPLTSIIHENKIPRGEVGDVAITNALVVRRLPSATSYHIRPSHVIARVTPADLARGSPSLPNIKWNTTTNIITR